MTPDFSRLYSLLGIQPGCSLEEFKHAYRRRIAELHPDRTNPTDPQARTAVALNDLNSMYDAAMRFHKQHGRLPGAMPLPRNIVTPAPVPVSAISMPDPPVSASSGEVDTGTVTDKDSGRLTLVLLLLLSALLGLLIWSSLMEKGGVAATGTNTLTQDGGSDAREALTSRLELGMDKESVIAIQGNPVSVRGEEWYYGPSWLRFEDNRLVDWNSSPLYRLKTGSASQVPEPVPE